MSGSETGVVMAEQFPNAVQSPHSQGMRMDYASATNAVYKPVTTASLLPYHGGPATVNVAGAAPVSADGSAGAGGVMSSGHDMNMSGEKMKKKRGRPRKYVVDGRMGMALPAVPISQSLAGAVPISQSGDGFSSPPPPPPAAAAGGAASPTSSTKKARGRPVGSTNKKHQIDLGTAGMGFTPHIITVKAGEDVSSKIRSFSQTGPRAVCILSATGALSNVTLRQADTSGGTVTYEGRFEILSLCGSFLLSENGGLHSRTGGLSVSLSSSDGRVLGGPVAGLLKAACPIQVVAASFAPEGRKEPKSEIKRELPAGPRFAAASGLNGVSSPPPHGNHSEASGGLGSPLNQSAGAGNNSNPQGMASLPWK